MQILQSAFFVKQGYTEPTNLDIYKTLKEEVSKVIETGMKRTKTVGLSIALVDDQQIVWEAGFGYQDKERSMPATPNTIYQVGSITKLRLQLQHHEVNK